MSRLALPLLLWALGVGGQFSTEQALRDHMLSGYDVDAHPDRVRNQPTAVSVQVHFAAIWGFDQKKMSFKADLYLRERWNDTRLAYGSLNGVEAFERVDLVEVEDDIWSTRVFFPAAIETNRRDILFYVDPSGSILRSRRLVVTLKCGMYFARFPFDEQLCPVRLEPWSQPTDVSVLHAEADSGIEAIKANEWTNFRSHQEDGVIAYDTGNFSWATVHVAMQRDGSGWIKDSILPAFLFVLIAYCSFWINPGAVPARVGLSVITVLITMSLWSRILASMPLVTYSVWMTDYIFGCMVFNIVAFFSYTFVNFGLQMKEVEKARAADRKAAASAKAKKEFHEQTHTMLNDGIKRAASLNTGSRQWSTKDEEESKKVVPPQADAEDKGAAPEASTALLGAPPSPSKLVLLTTVDWHMRWAFPLGFAFYNICMFTFLFEDYPVSEAQAR